MYRFNGINWSRWALPVLSTISLLAVLLLFFPFDTGYSTVRDPLGWALFSTWTTQTPDGQDSTYCLLVPLIVAYLIFEKKSLLARAEARGSNAALFLVVLGLFLFWIGSKAGKQYIGCTGIQALVMGLILWFGGRNALRPLLFAWAILIFAWPWPFVDTTVAFPLRMVVSDWAFHALNLLGIPAVQSGTALYSSPDLSAGLQMGDRFQIDVADPCSGLHSLLPLLMFSALFSHYFLRVAWQQWLVFLSALPFAIIGNVVRILLLVLGCIKFGTLFAIGPPQNPSFYHEICGYFVFVVVLGLECLFGFILIAIDRRVASTRGPVTSRGFDQNASTAPDKSPRGDIPGWRSGVIFSLAAVAAIVAWTNPPPSFSPTAGVLTSLPVHVHLPDLDGGSFLGMDAPVTEAEQTILPKDTVFARKNYDDFHGHTVFFSIVLSGLQQYTIHPPQVCLVAQGWNILHEENVPIQLSSGRELVVRNLTIEREEVNGRREHRRVRAYYMYWYVADGVSTPSKGTRNWISSWDRIVHNRDHRWAYVFAMSPITESLRTDGLNAGQTRQMLADFIREIVPTFQKSELSALTSD